MYDLCDILQQVVDGLNDATFSQHQFVVHGHELVLHVGPQSGHQVYSVLEEKVKQLLGNVPLVGKELPIEVLGQFGENFRIFVAHIGSREHERDYFPSIVAHEMQLESVAPSHGSLSVGRHSPEHSVGIPSQIVAHGNHR